MEAHPRSDKCQYEFLPGRRKITMEGDDSAEGGDNGHEGLETAEPEGDDHGILPSDLC